VAGWAPPDSLPVIADCGGVSTLTRSWVFSAASGVVTVRTIALGEIEDLLGSVAGEPIRDKMTAPLAAAPTAQATRGIKRLRLELAPRPRAPSEKKFPVNRIANPDT
jgi:hypothetical protein